MRLPALSTLLVTVAIIVAATVSVGGGATYVALEVTTRPEFCKSCHIMEPYYDSWSRSSHKNVACVECHYEPGILETVAGKFKALSQLAKYVTQTQGSKPWAEVSDFSCMRSGCHSTRLLEGEISFGRIRFDHRNHLIGLSRGKQLRCTSCHSQIVQGNHLTVTTSSCFLCHFKSASESKPIDDCNTCHGAPEGEIKLGSYSFNHADYLARGVKCASCHGDVTRGTGDVPKERCGSCHNQQAHLDRIGDVEFIHRKHVTEHSVTCLNCHLEIQHGLPPREQHYQGDCSACHAGTHSVAADMVRGTGGRGVPDRPGVMYLARVTCNGCHRAPFPDAQVPPGGVAFAADPLACIDCHGTGFDGMAASWQQEIRGETAEVQKQVDDLHGHLGAAGGPARQHYEDAAYNLSLVMLDKSAGVHNLPYARDLLDRAAQDAHDGLLALAPESSPPRVPIGPRANGKEGCATMCHVGAAAIVVPRPGARDFPHEPHVVTAGLDCSSCHDSSKHGQMLPVSQDCRSCHHANEDADACATCHADVAALRGKPVPGTDPVPMQDLDCLSCHIGISGGHSRDKVGRACELCHAGEGKTVQGWLDGIEAPIAELEAKLKQAPPDAAAAARDELGALRRAGPWHNAAYTAATVARLRQLVEPPAPAGPPGPPPPGTEKPK